MLPTVVLTAVFLGINLDKLTLKKVKKNNRKSPPILSKRARKRAVTKPEIQEEILEKARLLDN